MNTGRLLVCIVFSILQFHEQNGYLFIQSAVRIIIEKFSELIQKTLNGHLFTRKTD